MTMLILGGHDRLEAPINEFAKEKGIKVKFINKPTQNLEDALCHADMVLIITSLVSHEMVRLAKKHGSSKCIFCRHRGICRIKRQIEDVLKKNFCHLIDIDS